MNETTNNRRQKTGNTTTSKASGRLINNGQTIVAQGVPPYDLQVDQTKVDEPTRFFEQWMRLKPGDPCFIGEISRELTDGARRQLAELCKFVGGDIQRWWANAALTWAAVINSDCKWNLGDFTPIYEATINAGWALRIMIMATGERFVVTPRGICTLPEFQWQYGQDLLEYLREQQALQQAVLERVIEHLTSVHEDVWVRLEGPDKQEAMHCIKVLACQQVDDWIIPEGYRLISRV